MTLREKLKPLIEEMLNASDLPDNEVGREIVHTFLTLASILPEEAAPNHIETYILQRQRHWPEQWENIHIDPKKVARDMFEVWSRTQAA